MDEVEAPRKVSVVIVSYNCVTALRRCLEALGRSVSTETFEVLVVDNGSRDESGSVDQEFPNVTVLRIPRNFGLTKARNIGIRTAKAPLLFLLDPQVEVAPETVPALADHLESNPAAVAVAPLVVDPGGNPVSRHARLPGPPDLRKAWNAGQVWAQILPNERVLPIESLDAERVAVECADPRALLVRSQFIRGMNYFDEKYGQFGSDWELYLQAKRAGKKIVVLPNTKVLAREGEGMWTPAADAARSDLDADYAYAIFRYAGKHFGFWAGLKLRILVALGALVRSLGTFTRVVSGQKIDGSQQGL